MICDYIMTFLANSNLILQIYHAKIDSNGRQKAIPKGVDETHQSNLKPGPYTKKCLL